MRKFNQTEKLVVKQRFTKKPVDKWQVVTATGVQFENVNKGLCIWFCRQYAISLKNIKAISYAPES